MCLLTIDGFCVQWPHLFVTGAVLAILVLGIWVSLLNAYQNRHKSGYSDSSRRTDAPPPVSAEDEDQPDIKVGQKILYDESQGYKLYLVVTKVDEDESEVTGYFSVDMPKEAEISFPHFDCDNGIVSVPFKMPDGSAQELRFNTEDPDELDGYYVYIDDTIAVKAL